jgi:hypothetical protein
MRMLLVGDMHLSDRIWNNRPKIYGDSYFALEQVGHLAITRDVNAVVLAGDLLDVTRNVPSVLYHLAKFLAKMVDHDILVYFVNGQHCQHVPAWPNVLNMSKKVIHLPDLAENSTISGSDFLPKDQFQAVLKEPRVRDSSLFVCHQTIKDFMGNVGDPQASISDFNPTAKQLVFIGDKHEYHDVTVPEKGLRVISPGSTHMRSINEPADKFVFEWDSEGDPHSTVTNQLLSRHKLKVDLVGKWESGNVDHIMQDTKNWLNDELWREDEANCWCSTNMPEFSPELLSSVRQPIVQLRLPSDATQIISAFSNICDTYNAHLFIKVVGTTETKMAAELDGSAARTTPTMNQSLKVALGREAATKEELDTDVAYQLADRLLQGGEPASVLQDFAKEGETNDIN